MRKQGQSSKLWVITLCILIIVFISLTAYNIHTIKVADKRMKMAIEKYEQAIRDMETKLNEQNKDLMTEFYKLRLDWTNEKIELETKKGYIDREIYKMRVYAGAIMLLVSLGIWGWLRNIIEKNIEAFTGEDIYAIRSIMNQHKKEGRIKRKKKILILANNEEYNNEVKVFLKNMGFKHISTKNINDTSFEGEYDLIFLNNQDGNIEKSNKEKLSEIVKAVVSKFEEEKIYFYYNKGIRLNLPNLELGIKSNYANSEFTLYRNVIDTLIGAENLNFILTEGATAES